MCASERRIGACASMYATHVLSALPAGVVFMIALRARSAISARWSHHSSQRPRPFLSPPLRSPPRALRARRSISRYSSHELSTLRSPDDAP